ncbi:MAG: hypothetical protein AAGE59_19420 [Cyanobacteria bacterium P01_F01_bin.86]
MPRDLYRHTLKCLGFGAIACLWRKATLRQGWTEVLPQTHWVTPAS